jgi:ribosomal protein S18 acetylase RimI-like enzyme
MDSVNKPPLARLGVPFPTEPPNERGWAQPLSLVTLKSGRAAKIISGGDAVPGGYNGYYAAFDPKTGQKMGYLDYQSAYGDKTIKIAMVEVYPIYRGVGVSDALLARLLVDCPDNLIDPGMQTADGVAWWQRVKSYVPHDN